MAAMRAKTMDEGEADLTKIGYTRCTKSHKATGRCYHKEVDGKMLHLWLYPQKIGKKTRICVEAINDIDPS